MGLRAVSLRSLVPAEIGFDESSLSSEAQLSGRFVLVFDEARVLPFIKGINYRGLLQQIHSNYHNVSVVLTGSMPGLLEKIISPANASMPGFARYIEEIKVPK